MKRRTISVAALQLRAHDRDAFASVWPAIRERIREAAADGAELIVLPEGTVPGYVIGREPVESSVTERALNDVQTIAREGGSVVVYGAVRFDEGLMFNSAYVVDADGSIAGVVDKCFLWHFDRQWFAPGQLRAPVKTKIGNLGVMICADGRIPTIARSLADDGADALVMPTAWVTTGRSSREFENAQADLLARVRARENALPFVAANKTGVEQHCVAYCGKSQIVDAQGELLAMASQRDAEVLRAQITLDQPKPHRVHATQPKPPGGTSTARRIAITPFAQTAGEELLALLEADFAVSAERSSDAILAQSIAAVSVDDALFEDPAGLVSYRQAGYQCIVWRTGAGQLEWKRRLVRARALELRIYVICIIEGEAAFAADPDGVIVCGTFEDFRVATFAFSPERTKQTLVAPGTDILEGLERGRRTPV